MRVRLLGMGLGLLVAAAAQEAERNPRASAADIAAGARSFRSHCSPCHGLHGEGGRGPNLAAGQFYHGSTDADLLRNISDGIPGTEMPGIFFSPDRVRQIVAYLRSLNAAGAPPPGDARHGAELFRSRGCPQCHRVNGEGGRLGPDLTRAGAARSPAFLRQSLVDPTAYVDPRYWVVSFRDGSGNRQQGFLMNADTYTVQFIDLRGELHSVSRDGLSEYHIEKSSRMPSYKDQLAAGELQDLVAYLASLRGQGGNQ